MEKSRNLISTHFNKLKYVMLGMACLHAFNCLTRPDYNMFIYLFLFYVWFHTEEQERSKVIENEEKSYSIFLLIFSLIIDVVWTLFWSGRWSYVKDFERTAHMLVVVLSWIGILAKILIIFCLGLIEWNRIRTSLPYTLQEKLNANYVRQGDEI